MNIKTSTTIEKFMNLNRFNHSSWNETVAKVATLLKMIALPTNLREDKLRHIESNGIYYDKNSHAVLKEVFDEDITSEEVVEHILNNYKHDLGSTAINNLEKLSNVIHPASASDLTYLFSDFNTDFRGKIEKIYVFGDLIIISTIDRKTGEHKFINVDRTVYSYHTMEHLFFDKFENFGGAMYKLYTKDEEATKLADILEDEFVEDMTDEDVIKKLSPTFSETILILASED